MSKLKVQVISDIHTERMAYTLDPQYYKTDADLIIVAGDVGNLLSVGETLYNLFGNKPVVYVMGNHEHYHTGYDIDYNIKLFQAEIDMVNKEGYTNITFLNDNVAYININNVSIRCVGGTLWTDFNLYHDYEKDMEYAHSRMNDYRYILGKRELLTPLETRERHIITRSVIEKTLANDHNGPTFVVTHHLPSLKAVKQRYKKDKLTASFASDLNYLLPKATLWCSGHTHDTSIFREDETLFVCNPEGYRRNKGQADNKRFNPRLLLDVRRGGPNKKWIAGILD